MAWLAMKRVPEPEVMDESSEVDAYASATAQSYLGKIDRILIEHLARLLPRRDGKNKEVTGRALDVGCGPGQIPIMIAERWVGLRVTGIDAAANMIEEARRNAAKAGVPIAFQVLRVGPEGGRLPFDDASFDVVTCNSVLHHLPDPVAVFDDIARVAKPQGAVLIRDLRRPSAALYPMHVRWFGRHYSGEMRRLYEASVRAAYTVEELEQMLQKSRLSTSQPGANRARVFRHGRTHIGIERAAQ
jgi:ubiquinone/menaquinone biosynthesis C-methylase UbiE